MGQETSASEGRAVRWRGTGRYEVLRCIGKGGMGAVYEALDRERQQLVALKTLLHFGPAALYRFKQEFRTLADVHHTNLVHLYELVVGDMEQAFFTMELVRGVHFLEYVHESAARPGAPQSTTRVVSRERARRGDTTEPSDAVASELPERPDSLARASRASSPHASPARGGHRCPPRRREAAS